jgi:Cu+-exporting ATPase
VVEPQADVDRGEQRVSPGEDQGEAGREASLRMKIGGMSCSFCTSTIRTAYERMEGVREVGISLAHEEGLVKYDPGKVSEDELKRTLHDVGYTYRDPNKVVSFEEEETELRLARGRLIVAGSLTVVTVTLLMLGMFGVITTPLLAWIMLTLALWTMFVTAWFVKKMAFASLRRGILNQHTLLEFAAFAGLVGGFLGLFVSPVFPAEHFFAVSTFVTTYHILSDYVSKIVRTRSGQAIRKLLDLQPDTARVIRDGTEHEVPIDEIGVGEWVRIRPGESIPVDGEVTEGASAVDQALVTGEPIPEEKVAGDEVIGGSINQTGTLVVRVARVGEESFLAQVARSIEEARALRPGVLQLMDVVLKYFVRGVLGFAVFAFVLWTIGPMIWGGGPDWSRAVFATLAVLVLGYPCALGMATPLAMIRGGGMAAERGILMRSGEAFQIMGELRSVVLDKTGTITRGEPEVAALVALSGDEGEVLRLAAAVEATSEHPLARAVEDAAEQRGLTVPDAEDFQAHTGRGVEARVDGARVLVAKIGYLAEEGIDVSAAGEHRGRLEERGQTVVGVAREATLLGLIGIADALKDDAAEAVARMNDAGLTPVMITGDNERTAHAVAEQVGIEQVYAQVLPEDKAARVRELQGPDRRVAMVGDGINDAPALTQADVGIAIGAGTDIAIESADIVIMGERLGAVMDAYQIGRNSYAKTKQNLGLAFAFNGIGVPAATTGLVHPIWAMIAMVGSVTAVLTNSFASRVLRRMPLAARRDQPSEEAGPVPGAPEPEVAGPAGAADEQERVLRLEVAGMHCAGCAENIGRSLPRIEGVRSAVADHERRVVEVVHLPNQASEDAIREHIHELGFQVTGHAAKGKVQG